MGVYSVYSQTHPLFRDMEGPPYEEREAALLNFTWFLLLSTERCELNIVIRLGVCPYYRGRLKLLLGTFQNVFEVFI